MCKKNCSKCKAEKHITCFYTRTDRPHLRMSRCAECLKKSNAPAGRKGKYNDGTATVKANYRLPGGDRTAAADAEIKLILETYKNKE